MQHNTIKQRGRDLLTWRMFMACFRVTKEVTNVDTFVERHMNLCMCADMNRTNQVQVTH